MTRLSRLMVGILGLCLVACGAEAEEPAGEDAAAEGEDAAAEGEDAAGEEAADGAPVDEVLAALQHRLAQLYRLVGRDGGGR